MAKLQISRSSENDENGNQETTDWKHVIFLPFQEAWELGLMLSILLNALFSIYDLYFTTISNPSISVLYYICEVMFLLDDALAIMHRNMVKTRKKKSYQPRNLGIIIVDTLTLHPVFEVRYFLSLVNYSTGQDMKNYYKWKCVLRVYRLMVVEKKKLNQVGLNQFVVLLAHRFVNIVVIGQIFAALVYYQRKNNQLNWTANLEIYSFSRNSTANWWALSFLMMSGVVINNWPIYIKAENNYERIIFTAAMLLGFVISITLFIGRLVVVFKRMDQNYIDYNLYVNKIMRLLDEWEVDEELKNKTFDYYTMFYKHRQGIREMPELFTRLPLSLQKEVMVDIYWEALRHTHFFANTDMPFKRSVSLVMKSEFLLPGEFLFRVGELKAKMVYLVSGVIQALSKEDDDSPIISFSSGTVLGETACLMPCTSVSNLRAVTYCEIQCLHLIDLYQVLLNYPMINNKLHQQLKLRLQIAHGEITRRRSSQLMTEYTDMSLKNVKDRWWEIHRYAKKPEIMQMLLKKERIDCTVVNLDLLVLSHDVELRVESICLSGRCPCVMDPDTSFRKCCDYIVIFAIVVQSIIIPKVAFFQGEMSFDDMSVCFFMDSIYVLDIYLQLSTAIKDKNRLITNFKELVIRLLKKMTFIIDILATLPIDYLMMVSDYNVNIGICKLPRLFKIYKIFTFLVVLQHNIAVNNTAIRILKWFIFYMVSIYWFTGLLYLLAKTIKDAHTLSFWGSVMVTLTCYVGYGGGSTQVYTLLEMGACFVLSVIGHLTFSFSLAELISMMVLRHKSSGIEVVQWWARKSELVKQWLEPSITERLARFLYFHHTIQDCQVIGQQSIFSDAPVELRNEIVRHRIINCLKKVPLFQNARQDVLRYICAHAEIKLVPPESIMMDSEVKSDTLYVIMRGYCKLSSSLPGDLERNATSILEIGDTFPLLETLHDTFSFVSVECLTVVEVLLIKTNVVRSALRTYELDYICFQEALKEHQKIYGSILYRKGARLPDMKPTIPSKGKGNIFKYDIYDTDVIEYNITTYKKPFMELGSWSFVRFFLLKKTIRPTSWPYVTWEIIRCTCVLVYFLVVAIRYSILSYFMTKPAIGALSMFFDFIAMIDLYIRLHCQYYNEKGILITHPLYTARHYLKTAFIMDVMGTIQVHNFGLDRLLGNQYKMWVQFIGTVATRSCQLYRPFKGLSYLDNHFQGKKKKCVIIFRYVLLMLFCVTLGCTASMLVMCDVVDYVLYCDIGQNYAQTSGIYRSIHVYIYYMYTVTVSITLSSSGGILQNYRHMVLLVFMFVPMMLLRWFFLVALTSRGIGGNVEQTIYRDRMRNYMKFLKNALISDEDKQLIVTHYEYIWKKTHGLNMHSVIKNFHPQLEQDLARSIYHNCLQRVQLFAGAHISLFQAIAFTLNQEFYTKDTKIIRCNDIRDKVYFVHDGKVDVYIAGTLMCSLKTGGLFGCFSKAGMTRQTITAIASIHSMVLVVDTKLFYRTIEAFPKIMERLLRMSHLNYEFMEESDDFDQQSEEKPKFQSSAQYRVFYKKLLIFENNPVYRMFNYVTNVHIYPLSSIVILTVTFVNLYDIQPFFINLLCYFIDFIHLVKMCCKCHLIYIDPESGRVISDPYSIRRKYLHSSFWFDFFTLLPFELIADCYTNSVIIHNLCFLNRCLRFLYLVVHYYQCEERLLMKDHLKWAYMIYSILFQMHIFLCLWLLVACPHTMCWYRIGFDPDTVNFTKSETTLESTILAYLHVVNVYTGTDLKNTMPLNVPEVTVTLFMMIASQVLVMSLCANYISHRLINKHNFINYEVKFQNLGLYLQNLELSPFLYMKVSKYCCRLWAHERGDWLPILITESPPCLKENVLEILYGRHLSHHKLFVDTHVDFLRQLVVHLDRIVFSAGDSIVEKGDADCCMYFINSGEILMFEVYGKLEYFVGTLSAGSSFGEAQGLLCIPHRYSYRSKGDSEVLILNKSKWNYLLKWFPASKEQIVVKGKANGLLDANAVI